MNRHHIQTTEGRNRIVEIIQGQDLGEFGIIVEIKTGVRTTKQNSAIHQYMRDLATALNDAGLDMKKVIKPEVDIPWGLESVKEYLWRPIQKAVTEKKSTTDLERNEVSKVYETLNRHLASKFGVMVAFPSRFERG